MKTSRKQLALALFALGLAVGAATWLLTSKTIWPASAQPGGGEGGVSAENDEQWIDLIKTAEKVRSGEFATALPAVSVPRGATLLKSCEWLPSVFHATGVSNDPGATPGTGRTVMRVTDVSERGDGPEYVLVVDWNDDLSNCDPRVKAIVSGGKEDSAEIDRHICDEMQLAADGKELDDPTFRKPSKDVAEEYLRAFC